MREEYDTKWTGYDSHLEVEYNKKRANKFTIIFLVVEIVLFIILVIANYIAQTLQAAITCLFFGVLYFILIFVHAHFHDSIAYPHKGKETHTEKKQRIEDIIQQTNQPEKKTAKIRFFIISTIECIALICMSTIPSWGIIGSLVQKEEAIEIGKNPYKLQGLLVEPEETYGLDFDLENAYKKMSDLEFAAYAYYSASIYSTYATYMTTYNQEQSDTIIGSSVNTVDVNALTIKTQNEYVKVNYHTTSGMPFLSSALGQIIVSKIDLLTGERWYATNADETTWYQKVRNAKVNSDGVPFSNWDNPKNLTYENVAFSSANIERFGVYQISIHNINERTIKTAKKSRKSKYYYTVELTLDPTNEETILRSKDDIVDGSGDQNAYYKELNVEFTVWNNGAFRSFKLQELWAASVVISLNFDFRSEYLFSYSAEDADITKYPDLVEAKEAYMAAH